MAKYVYICVKIERETAKALLVNGGMQVGPKWDPASFVMGTVWVPKSQVRMFYELPHTKNPNGGDIYAIPQWLAREKRLSYMVDGEVDKFIDFCEGKSDDWR